MFDRALAVLDEVGSLASGLGAASDDVLRVASRLEAASRMASGSDGAWFAVDLGHEALVLSARVRELAEATAASARAFARADAAVSVIGAATGRRRPVRQPIPSSRVPAPRPLPDALPDDPVAALVAVARSQVGYREGRRNATAFGSWSGAPNLPWCASFVSWVFATSGRPLPAVDVRRGFVGVQNGRNWAIAHGRSSRTPRVGDIMTTVRRDGRGHTGIVVAVLPGGRIVTVEGNTTANGGREGVIVAERTRRVLPGMRFWRP